MVVLVVEIAADALPSKTGVTLFAKRLLINEDEVDADVDDDGVDEDACGDCNDDEDDDDDCDGAVLTVALRCCT